jgi:hypothetical protein
MFAEREIEQIGRALVRGEVVAGFGNLPELAVQTLDRIGRWENAADRRQMGERLEWRTSTAPGTAA